MIENLIVFELETEIVGVVVAVFDWCVDEAVFVTELELVMENDEVFVNEFVLEMLELNDVEDVLDDVKLNEQLKLIKLNPLEIGVMEG